MPEPTAVTPGTPPAQPLSETEVGPDAPESETRELPPFERIRDDLLSGRINTRDALSRLLDTVIGDNDAYADEAENGN